MQVVLTSGLDEEAKRDLQKGTHHGGQHLHQLLKFLTVRTETDKDKGRVERSAITAVGGPHNAALDGRITDPAMYAVFTPCLAGQVTGVVVHERCVSLI